MAANWYKQISKTTDNLTNDATGGNFKALQSQQALGTIGSVGSGVAALTQALSAAGGIADSSSVPANGVGQEELQQQSQQKTQVWSESAGALVSLALAAIAFMV